jgi:hypothetical protein
MPEIVDARISAFEFQQREERKEYHKATQNGTNAQTILEERLKPLHELISEKSGELIAMSAQGHYAPSSGGSVLGTNYLQSVSSLEIGLITPETRVPLEELGTMPPLIKHTILTGVRDVYNINASKSQPIQKGDDEKGFNGTQWDMNPLSTLYFMDKPALEEEERNFPIDEEWTEIPNPPRLRFLVGNDEVTNYLQSVLIVNAWVYDLLGETLDVDFPHNDNLRKRIEEEQLEIYDKLILAERSYQTILADFNRRLKEAKTNSTYGENSVRWSFGGDVKKARKRFERQVEIARMRKYDQFGISHTRSLNPGIVENFDFSVFFSDVFSRHPPEDSSE